ncbi:hypothetical protein ACET3X_001312 [Alternaria dauci]|uniref:Uncharacterized protein n=1 Tax=Alternaria dauci TaxID=48095 RepID=A0ABR3UWX6_9PLEO
MQVSIASTTIADDLRRVVSCMAPANDALPTKHVRIDAAFLTEQQRRYPLVLAKLRDAIPPELYPTAEASPQDIYYGHPFYPGRVLLGTNDGSRVWSHLRRVRKNHKTLMEIHYDDNRGGEEGHTPFAQSDFLPWCRVGAHEWEERVKRVVKIVMLEAGYSESVVSQIPSSLLTAIRMNLEKGPDSLPPATGLDPGWSTEQVATSLASSSALDLGEELVDSVQRPGVPQPKPRKDPAAYYIKMLRDVIPVEHWFQTLPIPTYEEQGIVLLEPDSKEYFALFPGKVLLGRLRSEDETQAWAAFRRPKPVAKVQTLSGPWRMCLFDDNLLELELPETLSGTVNFAPAFQLLTEGKDVVATSKVLQDDGGFVTRQDARPRELAALIKSNWMRLRRIFQGPGRGIEQETSQPPLTQESRKTRTAGASAVVATTHDQVHVPEDDKSSKHRQQTQPLTTVSTNSIISQDEDDILETAYPFAKPDKQFAISKRTAALPPPNSSMTTNRKQKTMHPDPTSLLDFIDFTTAKDTPDSAALREQVQVLTEAKTAMKVENSKKNEYIVQLKLTISDMKDDMNDYKKKVQELETFKAKHVEHCQAVMLKLLTQRNLRNGSSETDAERDARREYTEVYGLEIVGRDAMD